jgi:hypothetical protein
MLNAPTLLVPLAFALAALGNCQQRPLSPNEEKLVGTWDRTGMDFTERTVYRRDRTLDSTMADGSEILPFRHGTWRMEGDILVEEYQIHWEPVPNETPFPKEITRTPIIEFHPDKLIYEKGRPPLKRVK